MVAVNIVKAFSRLDPSWASINLAITLCIECSGIHRSLGVHLSKVRSLKLDDWEDSWVTIMLSLGNKAVNSIYEGDISRVAIAKPDCSSDRTTREAWIKAKYVQKTFVKKSEQSLDEANLKLHTAVASANLTEVVEALASGADINRKHEDGATCLHSAVRSHRAYVAEFLLLNGAKINSCDNKGRTPMFYAVELGNTGPVCLLIKRGADLDVIDVDGHDALSIAIERADADIVTL